MRNLDSALSSKTPQELKIRLLDDAGILVDDAKAQELFNNKENVTEKEIIQVMVDSVNSGNITIAGRLNAEIVKQIEESGIMNRTPLGSISKDLPVVGKKIAPPEQVPAAETAPANTDGSNQPVQPIATEPTVTKPVATETATDLSSKIVSEAANPAETTKPTVIPTEPAVAPKTFLQPLKQSLQQLQHPLQLQKWLSQLLLRSLLQEKAGENLTL